MKIRRHLHTVLALLLPLMLLRAVLPPGYMPVATDGGLRIVMCSAGLSVQADGATGSDHSQVPDGGSCVFAHAATFAPPAAVACCAVLPPALSFDVPATAQPPLPHRPAALRRSARTSPLLLKSLFP